MDIDDIKPASGMREKRLPRRARDVQNKAPAPLQITAEQILREANEMQFEREAAPPRQQITDPEELDMYKLKKRKNFENTVRRNSHAIGVWLKYAAWEESQKEYKRGRSIFERVLEIDYTNTTIWLKYAEMEQRNRFVNRARNVWDRAVALLPRVDQLWYKYALMEEQLHQFNKARLIFERWMKWKPGEKAWMRYIALEQRSVGSRGDKIIRCRKIYDRFVLQHESEEAYVKYASWELKRNGCIKEAREIYEVCMNNLSSSSSSSSADSGAAAEVLLSSNFYREFAKLEIQAKEYERARVIFEYALDHIPQHLAIALYNDFIEFEKQFGNKVSIDMVILKKRRIEYENEIKENAMNYDLWFDYLKLEEQNLANEFGDGNADTDTDTDTDADINTNTNNSTHNKAVRHLSHFQQKQRARNIAYIRQIYERAIANVPPIMTDKRYWKRYIYLWIKYALFEELIAQNVGRTRAVYDACRNLIPNEQFTFGKIWIMYAEFELRQLNLARCRQIYGIALGKCPKKNVFFAYIKLEFELGHFERCRKLYQKFVETFPENQQIWIEWCKMECKLEEFEAARFIYEVAISNQDVLELPEHIWRSYIDLEIRVGEYTRARALFERLLTQTKHAQFWIAFAKFESTIDQPHNARDIFAKADLYLKKEISKYGNSSSSSGGGGSASALRTTTADTTMSMGIHGSNTTDGGSDVNANGTAVNGGGGIGGAGAVDVVVNAVAMDLIQQRVCLLDVWMQFESQWGSPEQLYSIEKKQPKRVKKQRRIYMEDGVTEAGWEEFYDYIFPDHEIQKSHNLKLLEKAKLWRMQKNK